MANEYIAVNNTTRTTTQVVKMTGQGNEFTGEFSILRNGTATNIKDIFIQGVKVNNENVTPDEDNVVNITTPEPKVFKATDQEGGTALNLLEITPADVPSQGDVLIVDHPLTQEEHEYTAYTHDGTGWVACSGKMDASKVILTQDITMAGDYDKIGNFTKAANANKTNFLDNDTKGTKGVSVQELIKQMFQKTINPVVKSEPSTGTSVAYSPTGAQEYGRPVTATYTFSLTDGQFTNGNGTDVAAGCEVDTSEEGKGYHVVGGTSETSNTGSYEFIAGSTAAKTVSATIDYTASGTVPTDNFSNPVSSVKIDAGTTASQSVQLSVSSYRNVFYKSIPFANKLTDEQIKALTSEDIRAQNSGWTANKNKPTSWQYSNAAQFIVMVPANDSKPKIESAYAGVLPFTFTKLKAANGTDDFTISINGYNNTANTGTDYVVWVDNEGSNSSDTISITWAS